MASKVSTNISDEQWKLMEEEYDKTMKIIALKYVGVTLIEQDILRQQEDEKTDAFIKRISKIN